MEDTYKYLVYLVNFKIRKDKSGRSYVIFGDICSEIEFLEACSSKFFVSLRRVDILRIKFEDMKNTC